MIFLVTTTALSITGQLQWNLYTSKSSVQRTVFFAPVMVNYLEEYLDITKPRFSERILPVSWPLVISRFYCTTITLENIKFKI